MSSLRSRSRKISKIWLQGFTELNHGETENTWYDRDRKREILNAQMQRRPPLIIPFMRTWFPLSHFSVSLNITVPRKLGSYDNLFSNTEKSTNILHVQYNMKVGSLAAHCPQRAHSVRQKHWKIHPVAAKRYVIFESEITSWVTVILSLTKELPEEFSDPSVAGISNASGSGKVGEMASVGFFCSVFVNFAAILLVSISWPVSIPISYSCVSEDALAPAGVGNHWRWPLQKIHTSKQQDQHHINNYNNKTLYLCDYK